MQTIFLLLILVQLSLGQDNFLPQSVLSRIEALEVKDAEKSAEISQLEREATLLTQKQDHLLVLNNKLRQDLAAANKLHQVHKESITLLHKELGEQKGTAAAYTEKIGLLEHEVKQLSIKQDEMFKIYKEQCKIVHEVNMAVRESKERPDNTYENSEDTNIVNDSYHSMNVHPDAVAHTYTGDHTVQVGGDDMTFGETVGQIDKRLTHNTENWQRETEQRERRSHSRRFLSTIQMVAFHSVISATDVEHLGTNDNIRFDKVLLNEGNGYHNQHGVFIAPKSGFYLFSVSIGTNFNDPFYATLVKNGATLANIAGDGESGPGSHLDQGSVTVVTMLQPGDEVWVKHVSPADGSIWGNYFSSFSGILVYETEK